MAERNFIIVCRDCDSELELKLLNDDNGAEDMVVCPVCGSDNIQTEEIED